MSKRLVITSQVPVSWEEQIEEKVAKTDKKSVSGYVKDLVAQDLGLSDIPRLACDVTDAMFEDFHAACKILDMLPDDLLKAIVQFHLENDQTLLSKERFNLVYKYPHEYTPLKKST